MKNNFGLRFSFLVGVSTFIVALAVGFYSNNISTKQLEINSGESLIKLSKRINDILDREMFERYREMKFVSTLPILTNENSTVEEKRELIQKVKDNYNHHEWIGYALPDGTVEVGTNGYLEGKNVKARPWHPNGLVSPYIGDVHDALLLAKLLPNNSGEPIYFSDVAFPVVSNEGKTLGVICTHLTWQWTRDVIRSIQKEHGVEIFLLSKDGMVLVGPNNTERMNLSDLSLNVAQTFNTKDSMYKVLDWNDNISYLTASSVSNGFEEYKGFSWKVIVRQPASEAFKIVDENKKSMFMISFVLGLIGAIIGIFISSFMSRPLNEFSQMAEDKIKISLKIFEQALEGIIVTDKDNKIIFINKAFTTITGYELNEVYGKNPSVLSSGLNKKEFYLNMWNDISKNGKWEGYIKNRRKDGSIYEEHLKISSLKDENNELIHYIATFNSGF